jgi:hypothetical protein
MPSAFSQQIGIVLQRPEHWSQMRIPGDGDQRFRAIVIAIPG